jgi:hypothetical protein
MPDTTDIVNTIWEKSWEILIDFVNKDRSARGAHPIDPHTTRKPLLNYKEGSLW